MWRGPILWVRGKNLRIVELNEGIRVARLLHLIKPDGGLHRLPLRKVVAERHCHAIGRRQQMLGVEPVPQQRPRGLAGSRVAAVPPRLYALAHPVNEWRQEGCVALRGELLFAGIPADAGVQDCVGIGGKLKAQCHCRFAPQLKSFLLPVTRSSPLPLKSPSSVTSVHPWLLHSSASI